MPVNQVYKATGEKIIDISDSTVTAEALKEGFTAYNAAGEKITGAIPLSSWEQLQQKVRNNDMSDISIGDQYACLKGSSALTWDVIDKNKDTPANPNLSHALTLRVHNLLPDDLAFDAVEAFYACRTGALNAGTYRYETVNGNFYFTLTQPVPVGGQLVCPNETTLYSFASSNSTTPIESVSVTKGYSGTYLGKLANDSRNGNLNTGSRRTSGSNDWKESAIRQWLNSDKPAGQWWEPQTPWDRPPTYAKTLNGFLYDLDPEFLAVIGKTRVKTKYFDASRGVINGTYTTEDYFFLMSLSQVSSDYSGEGTKYTPYSDNASRIMYRNGSAANYRLRSPYSSNSYPYSNSYQTHMVYTNGTMSYTGANSILGVEVVCNII